MSIGNRQIGWSQESNLLWEISKQLDRTLSVLCTGPCPTTTTTTTAPLCNYLYEGTLTVGEIETNFGYAESIHGSISPLNSNFTVLIWDSSKSLFQLTLLTEECYSTIDVYINGIKYTLSSDNGYYVLEPISNPFPVVGETCIVQICPGDLCV